MVLKKKEWVIKKWAHGKDLIRKYLIEKEVIKQIISDLEAGIPPGKAIYREQMRKQTMLSIRGGRKMKLQAEYMKEANGSIKVTIRITDSGDFPTVNVFKSASENPSDETWNIGQGTESTISNTLPSPAEAKQWVSAQVNALKGKLDNWRGIWVPESEEFEV